ncbi:hypothetical protein LCGC14_1723940 [marine sediment metagenome]|uniref:Uncharacterized protein n=1 Tax=marine sediment metagenome TaxID=412755 RepID=A0A0F9HZC6_9ZZZZ
MKTESEWLQNFRRNLDSELVQREDKERKHIIIWELSWIDDRLRQIAKHAGKYVKVEDSEDNSPRTKFSEWGRGIVPSHDSENTKSKDSETESKNA